MKLRQILGIGGLLISLTGCAPETLDQMGISDQTLIPANYPVDQRPPPKSHGSIYQRGYEISLYEDHFPKRIGDILTIRLEEQTQGEKKAKMKNDKEGNYSFQLPSFIKGHLADDPITAASSQKFDGEGESNQENRLTGTVTVTVMRVLSNGNLVIQGESWLTINQGREYVRLTGIVRTEDISPQNTVSSTRVAHARISYSGNGQVGNSARGGVIQQFLLKFFPY